MGHSLLCHVSQEFCRHFEIGTLKWCGAVAYMDIGIIGVPIFLMISGSLLLNRNYTLSEFMEKRFSRILIPFAFWSILMPILRMIIFNRPWTFTEYYETLFFNQYWFVWMLIGVYLLLPILNSFIKEYEFKGLKYILIIWFISIILLIDQPIDLFSKIVSAYDLGWTSYFAGFIGYLPLGYYLSVKEFKWDDKKLYLAGLMIFIIFTAINMIYTITVSTQTNHLTYFKYRSTILTLQSIGLFLFIKYFSRYCENNKESWKNKIYSFLKDNNYMSRIILSISICSYGMYLCHYLIFFPLMYISGHYVRIFSRNPIILPAVWLFLCISTWLLVLLFSKIPVLRNFSGAY